MNTLEFNPEELELLQESLRQIHNEINLEVVRTDNRIFKEQLKHRRAVLADIINKLESAPVEV